MYMLDILNSIMNVLAINYIATDIIAGLIITGIYLYGGGIFKHRFKLQSLNICSKITYPQ